MKNIMFSAFVAAFLLIHPAWAQEETSDSEIQMLKLQIETMKEKLEHLQQRHEKEITDLRGKIRELSDQLEQQRALQETGEGASYEEVVTESYPTTYQVPAQADAGLYKIFNPDISVIGDMLFQYTSHENEGDRPDDEFIFRELEVDFSGVLDPFARADVVIAVEKEFGDGEEHSGYHTHIEEAYLTALSLPSSLQARVGRMRERFGKANTVHLHALPWVNYPLVIENYFGEEGLIGDGAEVSWLAPTEHYLELSYEIFNNDNNSVFAGEDYDDFVHLVHAKNLFEISDSTTIELGGSLATAPNDDSHGSHRTWLEGADFTVKWRPPEQSLYKGLTWQTEALLSQKDMEDGDQDTWGMYSSIEYQFARRWSAAARYDYSELPDSENLHENGYSAYLTFMQSEYVFWRLGYMFVDRNFGDPEEEDEHLLWVQLNFGLGPHRAHQY